MYSYLRNRGGALIRGFAGAGRESWDKDAPPMNQTVLRLVARDEADKQKALEAALSQIDRAFGKGSVM